jgi:hypothetical protein
VPVNNTFGYTLTFAVHDQLYIVIEALCDLTAPMIVFQRMIARCACGFDTDIQQLFV